jgi:hypothetical protein
MSAEALKATIFLLRYDHIIISPVFNPDRKTKEMAEPENYSYRVKR